MDARCVKKYIIVFPFLQVDSLGQILDLRNKDTCPCLKNVSKWSSAEIKDLSMKAFEQQMKELEEAEGSEVKLMRSLKAEYRAVSSAFLHHFLAYICYIISGSSVAYTIPC